MTDETQSAKNITCIIFDVDGVLTDGKIFIDANGREYKAFNSRDGVAIRLCQKAGIEVAIITGRKSEAVSKRMSELDVEHVYQGQHPKTAAYEDLIGKLNVNDENVAYVGDDLPDLPLIQRVGLGIAVADANPYVKQSADLILESAGGNAAAREAVEFILTAQNKLKELCENYL